jgi:hypothetical protein
MTTSAASWGEAGHVHEAVRLPSSQRPAGLRGSDRLSPDLDGSSASWPVERFAASGLRNGARVTVGVARRDLSVEDINLVRLSPKQLGWIKTQSSS